MHASNAPEAAILGMSSGTATVRVENFADLRATRVQRIEAVSRNVCALTLWHILFLSRHSGGQGGQQVADGRFCSSNDTRVDQDNVVVFVLDTLKIANQLTTAGQPRGMVEESLRNLQKVLTAIENELLDVWERIWNDSDGFAWGAEIWVTALDNLAANRSTDLDLRNSATLPKLFAQLQIEARSVRGNI